MKFLKDPDFMDILEENCTGTPDFEVDLSKGSRLEWYSKFIKKIYVRLSHGQIVFRSHLDGGAVEHF
jgi:hypothetical protein